MTEKKHANKLPNPQEFADLHGVSRTAVMKWIETGKIEARPSGKRGWVIIGNQKRPVSDRTRKRPNYPKNRKSPSNLESYGKHRIRKVLQMSMSGEEIAIFDSMIEASKTLGINYGNLSSCANGRTESAGGFKFKITE